jgi:hypothetical protein
MTISSQASSQHESFTRFPCHVRDHKDIAVAFYKKALFEGRVEDASGFTLFPPIASTIR